MKVKLHTIDTMLVSLLLLSAILPIIVAKIMVIVFFSFILLRIFFTNDIFKYANSKFLIFILFLPVILLSINYDVKETLRYITIMTITLGLPFSNFRVNYSIVSKVSIYVIFYLFITQILIMFNNQTIISFQEYAYKTEWSYVFSTYGANNTFGLDFFSNDNFRAGGLFYNPNILAGVIFLYFLIFKITERIDELDKKNINKKLSNIIFIIVFFSILLTKSRTVIISFIFFMYFKDINFTKIPQLRINKKFIYPLIIVIITFYLQGERIISGIFDANDSFIMKYSILLNYIENDLNLFKILFGGTFNTQFDTEYGKLFGASGLMGVFGYFYFLRLIYKINSDSKVLILSLLLIATGSTVFLSLLKISIVLPIVIIICSSKYINYKTINS
jgi:hypothetical protein